MIEFLLMDEATARSVAEATAGAEARLSPMRVGAGAHAGSFVLPARVAALHSQLEAIARVSLDPEESALEEAFVIEVADVAPMPPAIVSRRQMKLALLAAGKLDDVEAFVAASGDRAVEISWRDAVEFHRADPLLNAMAAMLQPPLAPTQVDDLFRLAATL